MNVSVFKKTCKNGNSFDRSIHIQDVLSTPIVCYLEARSLQYADKCILCNLEQRNAFWIHSILLDNTNLKQRGLGYNIGYNFLLANIVVMSWEFRDVDLETCYPSSNRKYPDKSFRSSSTTCEKENTFISGIDNLISHRERSFGWSNQAYFKVKESG